MQVVLRAALMYVLLLFLLRVTSRRVSRMMTPLDMVILFLFGGLSAQAILGEDRSFTNSVLAVATVASLHVMISAGKLRWPMLGRIAEGTPVVVYSNGEWDHRRMRELRIYKGDVMSEARQQGLAGLDGVAYAIVEPTGGVSLIKKDEFPQERAPGS